MNKKDSRIRRTVKTRARLKLLGKVRLCVHRTPNHIYAQIISAEGATVLASASTNEASVKELIKGHAGNRDAASIVGKVIAERGVEKGISEVSFDRSGFKYHGRVKSLAEAARENGLKF
ncbi:MAG: 50S ribosomal protein L18 [Gammaproteobacteria bacterium]|nr:50S ribosomal protein L18 [Gammaproteobacteria bacterium]